MSVRTLLLATALVSAPLAAAAQQAAPPSVTAPASFFKQPVGSDYFLANYSEYEAYLKRLASESDRMKLVDIGKTAEGRTQWVAIVSSPANLARLEEYRTIAEKLARGRPSEAEAQQLARSGKAIVWIDAGMHATETVTSQGQIQVLHRMLSQSDPETMRMLDDCIILFGHDNPDGMELVSNWYMRHADPKAREFATLPRLYQKYIGHDNNRDSFMAQMPETENVNRMLFREWYPQIVYNQHQTGPEGMVVFVPPFRDPFNFNYDPIVMSQLSEVGFAMHSRLISEGKAGSGMRSAARYSTWHNGMERSISYFHNAIGLLTEIIGGPTPAKIPLVPSTQLPRGDEMMPIAPRDWRLQDSLDYQWSLDRAVIDYASRNRERLLFNIWRMAANSIARGSRDSWTITPAKVDRLSNAATLKAEGGEGARGPKKIDPALYDKLLRVPEERDPRAYVIPAAQRDMPTAIAFLNALIKAGVEVERADQPFTAGGKTYAAGSYIVRAAQAYRPHVLDMFEPQDHPHDTEFPGGPPTPPYDITGYTLAYQMGIGFDRLLDEAPPPQTPVTGLMTPPPGHVTGSGAAGWLVGHETNNSFILTNRLLKAGVQARWLSQATTADGVTLQPGALWVPASPAAKATIEQAVKELGIDALAVSTAPTGPSIALKPVRIGLVDRWGGLISAGWTRWLLERFEFPFEQVFPQRLDAGNLKRDYDVLLFTDDALPAKGAWGSDRAAKQPEAKDTPAEMRAMLGSITDEKTVPVIAQFVKQGGAAVTIGSSGRLAELLDAPLAAALSREEEGKQRPLPTTSFYIPGSLLRARVDTTQPLAYGLPSEVDMFFNSSQSFVPVGSQASARRVSWFEGRNLLRSGWAVGQERLAGTIVVADVDIGKGKLFVMGPEVAQRAQSYGTFKFLFNALLYGAAER
ncbi:M14 family zinc carboxypeptidase [Sphingomonas sp. HITSZ_GF]|uniref:M14 family metallopeptidase n=1 Tax=Sphingomonas sp. HITSZ_GF TaxID=3037247 RepID=UPI00240D04FA|nr:M14 family metallopeptidase [Sphingomonas sp. HITSZ_GF]MDG2533840.1 M14 family zinc carboxypeptidase [Sphingomonas sp. HITSZ_GF]